MKSQTTSISTSKSVISKYEIKGNNMEATNMITSEPIVSSKFETLLECHNERVEAADFSQCQLSSTPNVASALRKLNISSCVSVVVVYHLYFVLLIQMAICSPIFGVTLFSYIPCCVKQMTFCKSAVYPVQHAVISIKTWLLDHISQTRLVGLCPSLKVYLMGGEEEEEKKKRRGRRGEE